MKALITILALVCCLAIHANGQSIRSQGLVVTGSLLSVTPRINSEANKPLILYDVRLYLQLRNDRNVPLIVFRPSDRIISRRILFQDNLNSDTENGDISLSSAPWVIPYTSDQLNRGLDPKEVSKFQAQYLEVLAMGMEHPYTPPVGGALMKLEPGEYFEFTEVITVEDGFKLEIKPRQSLRDVARNTPIAESPALRIEYKLSLKKHHPNDDLLKMVQERWKRFGHLIVDRNGDFSIQSDLILTRAGN